MPSTSKFVAALRTDKTIIAGIVVDKSEMTPGVTAAYAKAVLTALDDVEKETKLVEGTPYRVEVEAKAFSFLLDAGLLYCVVALLEQSKPLTFAFMHKLKQLFEGLGKGRDLLRLEENALSKESTEPVRQLLLKELPPPSGDDSFMPALVNFVASDSFQSKFEQFFMSHAPSFTEDEEHQSACMDHYKEFQTMFEEQIKDFCTENGLEATEFLEKCQEASTNDPKFQHYINILLSSVEYDTFKKLMAIMKPVAELRNANAKGDGTATAAAATTTRKNAAVKDDSVRNLVRPPPPHKNSRIEEGSKVEGNYEGRGRWYPGVIRRERANGTFDIHYDDGDRENNVDRDRIRLSTASAPSAPALTEGSKVEGNYRGRGRWYPGVIGRKRANGSFDINYDDGERELGVDRDMIRVSTASAPSAPALTEGSKVEGNYRGRGRWYPGVIGRKRANGSFDINYDDGERETNVAQSCIRTLEHLRGSAPGAARSRPSESGRADDYQAFDGGRERNERSRGEGQTQRRRRSQSPPEADFFGGRERNERSRGTRQTQRRRRSQSPPETDESDEARFFAAHPASVRPGPSRLSSSWFDVVAYIHTPKAARVVQREAREMMRAAQRGKGRRSGVAGSVSNDSVGIRRGAEVIVRLLFPSVADGDVTVNPREIRLRWLHDYHRAIFEFRLRQGAPWGAHLEGRVCFSVGGCPVASVTLSLLLKSEKGSGSDSDSDSDSDQPLTGCAPAATRIFSKVFFVAATADQYIVNQLIVSAKTCGMSVVDEASAADVVQVCWSRRCKTCSAFRDACDVVRAETGTRPAALLVRGVWWEDEPPPEMRSLCRGGLSFYDATMMMLTRELSAIRGGVDALTQQAQSLRDDIGRVFTEVADAGAEFQMPPVFLLLPLGGGAGVRNLLERVKGKGSALLGVNKMKLQFVCDARVVGTGLAGLPCCEEEIVDGAYEVNIPGEKLQKLLPGLRWGVRILRGACSVARMAGIPLGVPGVADSGDTLKALADVGESYAQLMEDGAAMVEDDGNADGSWSPLAAEERAKMREATGASRDAVQAMLQKEHVPSNAELVGGLRRFSSMQHERPLWLCSCHYEAAMAEKRGCSVVSADVSDVSVTKVQQHPAGPTPASSNQEVVGKVNQLVEDTSEIKALLKAMA
eukprot:COSAG01_NODE_2972_length_6774_cov_7.923146_1_plen_1153_part_00